jgi:hypothetical protein
MNIINKNKDIYLSKENDHHDNTHLWNVINKITVQYQEWYGYYAPSPILSTSNQQQDLHSVVSSLSSVRCEEKIYSKRCQKKTSICDDNVFASSTHDEIDNANDDTMLCPDMNVRKKEFNHYEQL